MRALMEVYPDLKREIDGDISSIKYPRPISEPPSPNSSRLTTPAASLHGSDDEQDSVDEEGEVSLFIYVKPFDFERCIKKHTLCI